jgi:hypothetical protein
VLEHLVRDAFLYKTANGAYIAGSAMIGRQAKARLGERIPLTRPA